MHNRRVKLAMFAVVAVALLLAVFGPSVTSKTKIVPEYSPAAQAGEGVSAKGTVESSEVVVVSSQLQGVIDKVFVGAGDIVEKGQLLLEFDMNKIEAQLLRAKASLAVAEAKLAGTSAGFRTEEVAMIEHKRQQRDVMYRAAHDEYERLHRLLAKDAVTLVEVDRARDQLQIADAQLKEADSELMKYRSGFRIDEIRQAKALYDQAVADLKYIESLALDYRIFAPIPGVIAERYRVSGESADIETPLLKLINPARARIRAELEETEVGKVREGQQAEVTADAYHGKIFYGTVTKVFPVVQKKTQKSFDPMASFDINTQEIHIKLDESSVLMNGMTVTVRFIK